MLNVFYTYAYLREDGTPYYIGKGKGHRAYSKNRKIAVPSDKSRILILKSGLTEEEAFRHERYMIFVLGRKDLDVGILWNFTNGGEGGSGHILSQESKNKIAIANKGKVRTKEVKDQIAKSVSGFKWFNNGQINIQSRTCPGEGWKEGRIWSWDSPRNKGMKWYNKDGKMEMFKEDPGDGWTLGRIEVSRVNNHTTKGKKWYNNGSVNKMFVDPPEGWFPGMLRK